MLCHVQKLWLFDCALSGSLGSCALLGSLRLSCTLMGSLRLSWVVLSSRCHPMFLALSWVLLVQGVGCPPAWPDRGWEEHSGTPMGLVVRIVIGLQCGSATLCSINLITPGVPTLGQTIEGSLTFTSGCGYQDFVWPSIACSVLKS